MPFRHSQGTDGTSEAGKAHQIRSSCFHLFSFLVSRFIHIAMSFTASFGISAPILAACRNAWWHRFIGDCEVFLRLLIVCDLQDSPLHIGAVGCRLLCLVLSYVSWTRHHSWRIYIYIFSRQNALVSCVRENLVRAKRMIC